MCFRDCTTVARAFNFLIQVHVCGGNCVFMSDMQKDMSSLHVHVLSTGSGIYVITHISIYVVHQFYESIGLVHIGHHFL